MSSQQTTGTSISVDVRNIGGIEETSVSLSRGVNVLAGRNATNRTSFLQALIAAMGGEKVSLKGDADEGSVELTIEGTNYSRILKRSETGIETSGTPYLSDPTEADLFAFLLEDNETRQAVARGEDLHEIIMRPVDTEAIQSEISRLKQRRRELDEKINEIDSLERRLTELESRKSSIKSEIDTTERNLEEKNHELQQTDASVTSSRENQENLEEKLGALKNTRSDLEDIKFQLETDRQQLEELKEEEDELESILEELPESVEEELTAVSDQIEDLRAQRREVDSTLSDLQSVIEFNEEMLGETKPEVLQTLQDDDQRSVTDQLVEDDTVVCWTCGSSVDRSAIKETLQDLRGLQKEKVNKREQLKSEINKLSEKRSELEARESDREQARNRLDEIRNERERRQASIEDLEKDRDELRAEIENLEQEVTELEDEVHSDLLDRHREVNELEFELEQLRSDLTAVESESESIESQLAEREDLQQQRDEVQGRLEKERGRIDQIQQEAVDRFNVHMNEVLGLLDYENLERIWIEQIQREVREGRRKTIQDRFELHIIRKTADGTTYEDTIDHLSESEREITGLIFALAGYLVHDVHETCPLLLLDSLEAIDSGRIADLIDYLEEYADYLVVALLPEDAATLDAQYDVITDI